MAYREYRFQKLKGYPKELDNLGLTPVYFPRQDGLIEHYALLDAKESEIFCTGDLISLVKEADKRIQQDK